MNEYRIWQVTDDDPVAFREYAFCSLDYILERHPAFRGGEDVLATLPRWPWERVYVYRTEKEPSLNWIYSKFNRGAGDVPEDFHGHSLSVSDIIETLDGALWFCDSIGWKRVRWSPEETEA